MYIITGQTSISVLFRIKDEVWHLLNTSFYRDDQDSKD